MRKVEKIEEYISEFEKISKELRPAQVPMIETRSFMIGSPEDEKGWDDDEHQLKS